MITSIIIIIHIIIILTITRTAASSTFNVIAALPNIDGALCESSVIPSLYDAAKFG